MQELFVRKKAGKECQGCLPIRLGQCMNVKIPPGQPPASGLGPSPCATIRPVPPGNPGTPTTTRASEQVNRLYCQDWNHPLPALKQQT